MVLKVEVKAKPEGTPPTFMDSLSNSIITGEPVGNNFSSGASVVGGEPLRISVSEYPVRFGNEKGEVVGIEYRPTHLILDFNSKKPLLAKVVDGRYSDEPASFSGQKEIEKVIKGKDLRVVFSLSPERVRGISSSEGLVDFLYEESVGAVEPRKPADTAHVATKEHPKTDPKQRITARDLAEITGRNINTILGVFENKGIESSEITVGDARDYVLNDMRRVSPTQREAILGRLNQYTPRSPKSAVASAIVEEPKIEPQRITITALSEITGREYGCIYQVLSKRGVKAGNLTVEHAKNYVTSMRGISDAKRRKFLAEIDKYAKPKTPAKSVSDSDSKTVRFSDIYEGMKRIDPDLSYHDAYSIFRGSKTPRTGRGLYIQDKADTWLIEFARKKGVDPKVLAVEQKPAEVKDGKPVVQTPAPPAVKVAVPQAQVVDSSRYGNDRLRQAFGVEDDGALRKELAAIGITLGENGVPKDLLEQRVIEKMDLNRAEKVLGHFGYDSDYVLGLHYAHEEAVKQAAEPKIVDLGGTLDHNGMNRLYRSLPAMAGIKPLINNGRARKTDLAQFALGSQNPKIRDAILSGLGLPTDPEKAKIELGRYLATRPSTNGYVPFSASDTYTRDQISKLRLVNGDSKYVLSRMPEDRLTGYQIARILYDLGLHSSLRNLGYEGDRKRIGESIKKQEREGRKS